MDIVFVVLHYKTDQDTEACVRSIMEKTDGSYRIVIVDNGSKNGSLERLRGIYAGDERVTFVETKENLGFARGLNAGIQCARERWKPRYVALLNNDTELLSPCLVERLDEKYRAFGFSVCGPMIISRDGTAYVNPVRKGLRSREDVQKSIARYQKWMKLCDLHLYGLYQRLAGRKKKRAAPPDRNYLADQTDVKLHGACWVLSEAFFTRFEGLDPSTFLYGEEDILYLHVLDEGLHTLYTPDIVIYHKEDGATREALPDTEQRVRFISRHSVDSLNIYLKLLESRERKRPESE